MCSNFQLSIMGCSQSSLLSMPDQFMPNSKQFKPKRMLAQDLMAKGKFKDAQLIGDGLMIKNKLEDASAIYRMIIINNPNQDYPFQALGNPQLAFGVYLWNIPQWYINRNKNNGKKNPYDALSLCNCQLMANENDKHSIQTLKWYRKELKKREDPRLMTGLANILGPTQKAQAIQLYTKALLLMPDKLFLHISLAFTYFQCGNKKKAIEYAESAAKLQPSNGYSEFLIAMTQQDIDLRLQKLCLIRNSNIQQRCFKEVSILYSQQKHNPSQALNYLQESVILQKKKGFEDFQLNIREIGLHLQLQNDKTYFQLAADQIANKNIENPIRKQCKILVINNFMDTISKTNIPYKEIIANISINCSNNRQYFQRYMFFANLFIQKKKYLMGIQCIEQSARKAPSVTDIKVILDIYRGLIKKYKSMDTKLATYEPKIYENLYELARISKNSDNLPIECYQLAIELRPKCVKSHYNQGQMYRINNCFQQAIDCFDKTLKLDLNFTLAEAQKAICLFYTGQIQQGLKSFKKVMLMMEKGDSNLDDSQKQCLKKLTGEFSKQFEGLSKKSTIATQLSASDKEVGQKP